MKEFNKNQIMILLNSNSLIISGKKLHRQINQAYQFSYEGIFSPQTTSVKTKDASTLVTK